MRVVVAAVASLVLFAGLAAGAAVAPEPAVDVLLRSVAVPAPGGVVPAFLDDGEPVFVVAHRRVDGGGLSVVSPINPHLDIPVVWCPSDRRFYEPGPASTFDEEGTWVGGPAPEGLVTFDVVLDPDDPDVAWVGARRPAVGRERPALAPTGPPCDWDIGRVTEDDPGVERILGVTGHDLPARYGPPAAPEDVPVPLVDGRWDRFTARVSTGEDGRAVLCSPREAPGCPRPSPPVLSMFAEDARRFRNAWTCVGDVDGEVLAEVTRGSFAEVAVMPAFAGVGVAPRAGYADLGLQRQHCRRADGVEGEPAEVVGVLVDVIREGRDGQPRHVAVLDAPVRPVTLDARRHPHPDLGPGRRWVFDPLATLYDLQAGFRPPSGRRLPKTTYLPEELGPLLERRGPRGVRLTIDAAGRVTGGMLEEAVSAGRSA